MVRLLGLAGALFLAACAGPRSQPEPFDSQRVTILMGGMRMVEGFPAIQVALKNKTPEELWVLAKFGAPKDGRPCELFEPLAPGASFTFSCSQPDLVFDAVYPVSLEVFADEARAIPLEQQATEFVFGSEFRYLLEAVRQAELEEARGED